MVSDIFEDKSYTGSTKETYRRVYHRFIKYCEENCIKEYSEVVGQQFIEYVQSINSTMKSGQLHRYISCIRRLNCISKCVEWQPYQKQVNYAQSCFNAIADEYQKYLIRTGKASKGVHDYLRLVTKFLQDIEQLGYSQLDLVPAKAILSLFERASCKISFRSIIGLFLKYAYERGYTKSNLRIIIPPVVHHQGVPSVYSPEEIEQLLNSIDRTTETGKRNYAVILVAARLGLRASDIANLRFDNLRIETNKIVIKQIKTKFPLTLVLLDDVREAVFDYIDNARPSSSDDHIFLNEGGYGFMKPGSIGEATRQAFKKSGIECGNRRRGSHSLRASLATALLHEDNSYYVIQRALGLKRIQTTKSYIKADIERLRVNALPVPLQSGNFASLLAGEGYSK